LPVVQILDLPAMVSLLLAIILMKNAYLEELLETCVFSVLYGVSGL
jgi:hypothetical protein